MNEEKKKLVIAAYERGMTCRRIVKEYGVATNKVAAILREHGIKTRLGRLPSCTLDHSSFDEPNEAVNYWVGFLFADGSITDDIGSPQIILDIGVKDRDHLVKFASFLKSDHAIRDVHHRASTYKGVTVQDRDSVAFRVRSKRLVEALKSYGLCAGKSKRVPSSKIQSSRDFWRGCVDGDGTVDIYPDKCGYEYAVAKLFGQEQLIQRYQDFLKEHGVIANITRTGSGIFQIQLMGKKAVDVVRVLYSDAVTFLNRKMRNATEIMVRF